MYKLFQENSTIDSPDLSPGSSPLDTNRTNRTRSSGGKYESAPFWVPAEEEEFVMPCQIPDTISKGDDTVEFNSCNERYARNLKAKGVFN